MGSSERVAFLFDMDGTLADTMPYHVQAWMTLLAEHGLHMERADFLRKTAGKTNPQIIREVLGLALSPQELAAFEERKEALFRTLCRPHLALIPGAIGFLEASRKLGVAMAVATAAGKENRRFVLDGLGLTPYFTAVVGAEDVRYGKPHPEIFLKAAERLGVEPAACVVFEDASGGIEAARRAGMRAVALTTSLDAAEFRGNETTIRVAADFTALHPATLRSLIAQRVGPSIG